MLNIFHIFFVQKPVLETRFSEKTHLNHVKPWVGQKNFFMKKYILYEKSMNLRIFFCCKIYEFKNVLVSGWVRSFFILQCVDWPMIMIFTALSGMSTLHIARKMQKKLFVKNQHWGRGEACRKSNIEERWRNSNSKSIILWQPCVTLRAPKDTRALRFCWRLLASSTAESLQ